MDFRRLPREVTLKIFHLLPLTDQKSSRLTCQFVNFIFQNSEILQNFPLIMDGSSNDLTMTGALLNTTTPWTRLKFVKDFDLINLLELESAFVKITRQVGPNLQSLTISHCQLHLGRFMEFLSFFPSLVELNLIEVPTFYSAENPVQLLNWEDYIVPFKDRLKSLQKLSLVETKSYALDEDKTAWFLLDNTASLRSLKIHTSLEDGFGFPLKSIVRSVHRCAGSLRELDVSGNGRPDLEKNKSIWGAMSRGKINLVGLEILKISTINMGHFEQILPSFGYLTILELKNLCISYENFSGIGGYLVNLRSLVVEDSLLEEGVLGLGFQNTETLQRVRFSGNRVQESEKAGSTVLDHYIQFFNFGPSSINDVEIVGADYQPPVQNLVKQIIAPSHGDGSARKLRKLSLTRFEGFQKPETMQLFLEISEGLRSLNLSNTDVDDLWATIFPRMQGLESLYLRHTQVSLPTAEQLILLPNLRQVDLNDTFEHVSDYEALFALNFCDIIMVDSVIQEENEDDEENGDEESEEENEETEYDLYF